MCRHSELPQGSKMGTTRAGSAVSMEAEKLKINYISIWIFPPQNIYIYISQQVETNQLLNDLNVRGKT